MSNLLTLFFFFFLHSHSLFSGDVNLFLSPTSTPSSPSLENQNLSTNLMRAELEIMIGSQAHRHQGFSTEVLKIFITYCHLHSLIPNSIISKTLKPLSQLKIEFYFVKIGIKNEKSLKLFQVSQSLRSFQSAWECIDLVPFGTSSRRTGSVLNGFSFFGCNFDLMWFVFITPIRNLAFVNLRRMPIFKKLNFGLNFRPLISYIIHSFKHQTLLLTINSPTTSLGLIILQLNPMQARFSSI